MFENFEIKPLFEDQVHERHQFELNFQGDTYQGVFHDGEINWFHPQPHKELEEEELQAVETEVHKLMGNHLEQ
ncbi:DUF5342 family protein [Oceanobacillus chungangensis]|uniref:YheE family protein n=1 Tax=Oceanobacillus chungangensis TaxID=1229152 RepID=A0A3D8PW47_9BACI|nr:DUF5342 family protein [Oceanobacillus chungangensis]RDW19369.1 hypothetical protein CWR45_08020 [Oceanobacillus chungangensis]